MVKRLMIGIIVTAVLGLLLAGCAAEEETTTTTEAETTTTTEGEAATGNEETQQSAETGAEPSIAAASSVVPLSEDTKVVLTGAGFEPGQEIHILIATNQEGLEAISDLTYACDQQPVANSAGAWVTSWGDFARWYVSKEWIVEGVYSIVAADAKNNFLATTSVAFYDPEKPQEEWPAWAQAVAK